nr:helix-turn-helix domain-containing protein [Neisseria iguanae]
MHTTQKYTIENKLKTIGYVKQKRLIPDKIALVLDVSNTSVFYQWLQGFKEFGINGLIDKPKGRKTVNKPKKPKKQANTLTRLGILE